MSTEAIASVLPGQATWTGRDVITAIPLCPDDLPHRRPFGGNDQLQRYSLEYELAAEIQRHLLPKQTPQPHPFDLAAVCRPCRTLGGDFYDFFPLCGGQGIAIGDVSGKGLPASILMTSLRAGLRAHAEDLSDLREIMRRVNDDFARDTRDYEFATLFLGVLDSERLRLTYCSAGHEPALLVRDGQVTRLSVGGMAVGITPGEEFACDTIELCRDDVVAVFTDGVTEARDADGLMFGRDRVGRSLLHARPRDAMGICNDLVTELNWFIGTAPRTDDVTLLTIRAGGAPATAP